MGREIAGDTRRATPLRGVLDCGDSSGASRRSLSWLASSRRMMSSVGCRAEERSPSGVSAEDQGLGKAQRPSASTEPSSAIPRRIRCTISTHRTRAAHDRNARWIGDDSVRRARGPGGGGPDYLGGPQRADRPCPARRRARLGAVGGEEQRCPAQRRPADREHPGTDHSRTRHRWAGDLGGRRAVLRRSKRHPP